VSLGRSRLWDIWFDGENVSADFMIEREQPGDQEREVL
jgi:antitoxin VapB